MNVEQFHAIALAIKSDLDATTSVPMMREFRDALRNSVNDPANPTYEQQVSDVFQRLGDTLPHAPSNSFPPIWIDVVSDLNIQHLLGNSLRDTIHTVMTQNQVTPSIAADRIQELTGELEELENGIAQTLEGLAYFEFGAQEVEAGAAEVSVTIPRDAVDGQLSKLGEEFSELEKLVLPFVELATGSRRPVTVSTIASSDFGVFVDLAPEAASSLALAIAGVIAGYKNLLEIRRLRQEMSDQGVGDAELKGVDDHANNHMSQVVEDVIEITIRNELPRVDGPRTNELRTELKLSLNAFANRIDRGYNIDVRAGEIDPAEEEDSENGNTTTIALRTIAETSPNLRFINRTGQPILELPEPATEDDDNGITGDGAVEDEP